MRRAPGVASAREDSEYDAELENGETARADSAIPYLRIAAALARDQRLRLVLSL